MFESQIVSSESRLVSSGVRTARLTWDENDRRRRPLWDEIDQRLRGIAARRAGLDLDEARWLLVARREQLHRKFGYARLEEYMERVLGYGPHAAAERLRVAEELVGLPATRAALDAGELNDSAVRELTRVMIEETEGAWLAAASGRTLREIEPMVAGRKKGDLPDTPPEPGGRRHVVRFEMSGETLALLRDARIAIADATGEQPDHDALVAMLCRAVLDGGEATEPTRARSQIAITTCDSCRRGWQDGGGTPIEVGTGVIERALCDAEHLGRVDAAVPARATQDIPPSVRRLVWRRDHGGCAVPGCRSTRFLDLHHIEWRSEGGDHSADNLCVLCFAHHQAVHERRMVIRGRVSTGLTFVHADGRPYGAAVDHGQESRHGRHGKRLGMGGRTHFGQRRGLDPAMIEDAVAAVRGTGYRAAEARAAVAAAVSHGGSGASLEALIRGAFQQLYRERRPE